MGSRPISPAMDSYKRIGNIGEAAILNKFVEMGVPVYIPFGDNEKSDLVADFNGKLNRIQVKTSNHFDDKKKNFKVSLISSTIRNKNHYRHKYSKEDIDYFGVYNIPTKMCLLLPIEKFSMKTIATIPFPYEDKTHNQYEAINYADYLFENIINK